MGISFAYSDGHCLGKGKGEGCPFEGGAKGKGQRWQRRCEERRWKGASSNREKQQMMLKIFFIGFFTWKRTNFSPEKGPFQQGKYSLPSINFQVDIRSFSGEYIQKRFGICIINPSNACFFHVQTTLVGYLSLQTPFRVFQTPGQEGHPMDLGLCRSKADGRLSSALVLWRCAVPRVSHQLPGPSRLRRSELFIWKRIWGEQMTFWKGVVFGVFFGNQRGWGK